MGVRGDREAERNREGRGGRLEARLRRFYRGDGGWPADLLEVLLCERMRISWAELQTTPAHVVQGFVLAMRAESVVADQTRRAAERDARRGAS